MIFNLENLVFSWGNRQDGRLGLDVLASFDESSCVCLPKPIFGSLHLVSEMSCKHWNAMIIAEKILNSKSMRSISYADYLRAAEFRSDSVSSNKTVETNDESAAAAKQEYESSISVSSSTDPTANIELETPPVAGLKPIFDLNMASEVPDWLKNDLAEADFIPIKPTEQQPPQIQKINEESNQIKVRKYYLNEHINLE